MTEQDSNQSCTSSCWGAGKMSHQCPSTKEKQDSTNIWVTTPRAKEMTMTVNKEKYNEHQEAEVIALSSIASSASSSMRETSSTQSDSDFSVSSLVQKWREAEARNGKLNNNNNNSNTGIAQAQNSNPSLSSTLESNVSGELSRANSVVSVLTSEPTIERRQGNVDESSLLEDFPYDKQHEEELSLIHI